MADMMLKRSVDGHFIDRLESLPRLDMIGMCEINFHDLCRRLKPAMPLDEIGEAFEEYARDYRAFLRGLELH